MHSINSKERNVGSNATIHLGPNLGRAFDIGPEHALLSRVHIHQVSQPAFHHFHTIMIKVHKKFRAKIDILPHKKWYQAERLVEIDGTHVISGL